MVKNNRFVYLEQHSIHGFALVDENLGNAAVTKNLNFIYGTLVNDRCSLVTLDDKSVLGSL